MMRDIEKTIILDRTNPLKSVDMVKGEVPIHNSLEGYIFSCSQGLSVLSTAVDKTTLAILLLEESYKNVPEVEDFTPDDFIENAIENYFIRSGAIYDRSLIFTSKLHDIGLSDESISHETLVTNSHIKKSGVASKLKSLRKVCTEYRLERNKVVHHGRYSEKEFDLVASMHKLNNYSRVANEEPAFDQDEVDAFTRGVINVRVDEFRQHLAKIISKLDEFYEACEPVYLAKRLEFDK